MSALSEQLAKAETLREAASLMRERAEAADATEAWAWRSKDGGTYWPEATRSGRYIQSWHPAVALAVADWLDSVALSVDKRDNPEHVGGQHKGLRIPDEFAALNVARTYLDGAA